MLRNHPAILVVEDEPFIAIDLAMAIEDAGGEVIGPAPSVRQALTLLKMRWPAGAILDVNLPDGDISPMVIILAMQRVPLVVQTGVGLPAALAARFPDLLVLIKPVPAELLVDRLAALLDRPG